MILLNKKHKRKWNKTFINSVWSNLQLPEGQSNFSTGKWGSQLLSNFILHLRCQFEDFLQRKWAAFCLTSDPLSFLTGIEHETLPYITIAGWTTLHRHRSYNIALLFHNLVCIPVKKRGEYKNNFRMKTPHLIFLNLQIKFCAMKLRNLSYNLWNNHQYLKRNKND